MPMTELATIRKQFAEAVQRTSPSLLTETDLKGNPRTDDRALVTLGKLAALYCNENELLILQLAFRLMEECNWSEGAKRIEAHIKKEGTPNYDRIEYFHCDPDPCMYQCPEILKEVLTEINSAVELETELSHAKGGTPQSPGEDRLDYFASLLAAHLDWDADECCVVASEALYGIGFVTTGERIYELVQVDDDYEGEPLPEAVTPA